MAQCRHGFKVHLPTPASPEPWVQESCSYWAWLVNLSLRRGHQHAGGGNVTHTQGIPGSLKSWCITSLFGLPHGASLSVSPHGRSLLW